MPGSYAGSLRTAVLGVVGVAALAAGVLAQDGAHEYFLLTAVGGFTLGIAAAQAIAGARAEGRVEGAHLAEQRQAGHPEPPPPVAGAPGRVAGPEAAARAEGPEATGQEPGPAVTRAAVAAVAHDMSNPLAALKSNLEWLRDALEAGRLDAPEEQEEAREVLRDAREAAERLRADVGALRAAGRGEAPVALPPRPHA